MFLLFSIFFTRLECRIPSIDFERVISSARPKSRVESECARVFVRLVLVLAFALLNLYLCIHIFGERKKEVKEKEEKEEKEEEEEEEEQDKKECRKHSSF